MGPASSTMDQCPSAGPPGDWHALMRSDRSAGRRPAPAASTLPGTPAAFVAEGHQGRFRRVVPLDSVAGTSCTTRWRDRRPRRNVAYDAAEAPRGVRRDTLTSGAPANVEYETGRSR